MYCLFQMPAISSSEKAGRSKFLFIQCVLTGRNAWVPFTRPHRYFGEQTATAKAQHSSGYGSPGTSSPGTFSGALIRILPNRYHIVASLVTVQNIDIILVVSGLIGSERKEIIGPDCEKNPFRRTLNHLFNRLLRALIGGQAYERASSGNVIRYVLSLQTRLHSRILHAIMYEAAAVLCLFVQHLRHASLFA